MIMTRSMLAGLAGALIPLGLAAAPLDDGVTAINEGRYPEAMQILVPVANSGDATAQRLVGEMIFKGQGVNRNPTAAFKWTELAATGGDRIGQYNLAYLYEKGIGIGRSHELAMKWYEASAVQQYALAQRRLGEIYDGIDSAQALYWYNQARLNGDTASLPRYSVLAEESAARGAEISARYQAAQDARRAAIAEAARNERSQRGNAVATGILQGLGQVQQERAQISAIHDNMVADIERQNLERRAMNRRAAAGRTEEDRAREPVRSTRSETGSGAASPARAEGDRGGEPVTLTRSETASVPASPAAAGALPNTQISTSKIRKSFHGQGQGETPARTAALVAQTTWESGDYKIDYLTARRLGNEAVTCSSALGSYVCSFDSTYSVTHYGPEILYSPKTPPTGGTIAR